MASYGNGALIASAVLPALSVQLPLIVAAGESGPPYIAEVHELIPEKELPWKATGTGWLYQPLKSGGRPRTAVAVGLEISTLRR